MSFLPEEDREILSSKQISYQEKEEKLPDGNVRRGVIFSVFSFEGSLYQKNGDGALAPCARCDLLVLIPPGYATTKLDSFYTRPHLRRVGGGDPNCATVDQKLFDLDWQFWSRHMTDDDWKKGAYDLWAYLQIIRNELHSA